ncbi:MAG: hypothetical protein ACLP6E_17970, partial [Acidimicrobiales bacterium]
MQVLVVPPDTSVTVSRRTYLLIVTGTILFEVAAVWRTARADGPSLWFTAFTVIAIGVVGVAVIF